MLSILDKFHLGYAYTNGVVYVSLFSLFLTYLGSYISPEIPILLPRGGRHGSFVIKRVTSSGAILKEQREYRYAWVSIMGSTTFEDVTGIVINTDVARNKTQNNTTSNLTAYCLDGILEFAGSYVAARIKIYKTFISHPIFYRLSIRASINRHLHDHSHWLGDFVIAASQLGRPIIWSPSTEKSRIKGSLSLTTTDFPQNGDRTAAIRFLCSPFTSLHGNSASSHLHVPTRPGT